MRPEIIILLIAFVVGMYLLLRYRPTIDITKDGDVLLWYNYHYYNRPNKKWFVQRHYKHLFNICK